VGAYTTIVGYDRSIREPLLEHLARLDPRQVALNFSLSDPASDGLTHGMYLVLARMLADTPYADRLVSAEGVIGTLRGAKSPAEIALIKAAVRETDAIFARASQWLRSGLTAREIAHWFHDAAAEGGMGTSWESDYCPVVTPGPDAPIGHAMPGDFVTQRGHLLQADFGVSKDGFVSDLQRTWYLLDTGAGETEPPEEVLAG
ncbi:MAG: M24 family metallopeptidase, partial [bacterium]|nr:M24 family metallopeptidase [bacterium]